MIPDKNKILLLTGILLFISSSVQAYTLVKPGDTGRLILPVKNSAQSAGAMAGVEIEVVNPPSYFEYSPQLSQSLVPGQSYGFSINYKISSSAPEGGFEVKLRIKTTTPNCIPNPASSGWEEICNFMVDATLPRIVGVSPGIGAEGVLVSTGSVYLTFSEPMDRDSVKAYIPGGPYLGNPVWTSDKTVSFPIMGRLIYGDSYTVTLSGSARDLAGNQISSFYHWGFTTQAAEMPGGVDFRSVELAYISTDNPSGGLQFVFKAEEAGPGDTIIDLAGETKKVLDAFFTALAIPNYNQWISLPSDYVAGKWVGDVDVDPVFAKTELSRIMLRADAWMKFSDKGYWISVLQDGQNRWISLVKDSPYWPELEAQYFNTFPTSTFKARVCIIPGTVSVKENKGKLFVTDAKLGVEGELEEVWLDLSNYTLSSAIINDLNYRLDLWAPFFRDKCEVQYPAVLAESVNNDPEFADIRVVYSAVAAAQWYKKLDRNNIPYTDLIDSNNITGLEAEMPFDHDYWANQAHQYCGNTTFVDFYGYEYSGELWGGCVLSGSEVNTTGEIDQTTENIVSEAIANSYVKGGTNTYISATVQLPYPDLVPISLQFSNNNPTAGENVKITAVIRNQGQLGTGSFDVYFTDKNVSRRATLYLIEKKTVQGMLADSFQEISIDWDTSNRVGDFEMYVYVDCKYTVEESNEANNALSEKITILNPYPTAKISSPLDSSVLSNNTVTFTGSGTDAQDGILPDFSLQWTSDKDGALGSGSSIAKALSLGTHIITLTVTDFDGFTRTDQINITIKSDPPAVSINSPVNRQVFSQGELIYFAGSAVDPEEGNLSVSSLVWSSNIDGKIGTGETFTTSKLSMGDHAITLTATDSSGLSSTAKADIVCTIGNPKAFIDTPLDKKSFFYGKTVTFSGTGIDPQDGTLTGASLNWTSSLDGQIGTGNTFTKADLSVGTHIITLSVTDSSGYTDSEQVTVSIEPPRPPTASISSPRNGQVFVHGTPVNFSGSGSDYEDGVLAGPSLVWSSSIDGNIGMGEAFKLSNLSIGTHTIVITATDSAGLTNSVEVNIVILSASPTALITAPLEKQIFSQEDIISFIGSVTDPEDGMLSGDSLVWISSIDGEIGRGSSFTKTNLSPGVHTITLTAADSDGKIDTKNMNIIIIAPYAKVLDSLSDGAKEKTLTFNSGGTQTEYLKIPKEAQVISATLDLKGMVGEERQITNDLCYKGSLGIWGNTIVYEDVSANLIYRYDLLSNIKTRVTTYLTYQLNALVYGDKIIWSDYRLDPDIGKWNGDVYMYDLTTTKETRITTDPGLQGGSSIYGDKIVWIDNRNGNNDIYMYNLSTGMETSICTNVATQTYPAIYGNKIVWADIRNGNWDIYMYDLSAGIETQITENPAVQYWPRIYGDKIVWSDKRKGNYDIYMYDLSTGIETRICTALADQHNPAIYENRIVWADIRNGNWDIYMYDLSTGTEIPITTDLASQYAPEIYNDKIIWIDNRTGREEIWMHSFSPSTTNPTLDVSGDGDMEWSYAGEFTGSARTADFAGELNEYLGAHEADSQGNVLVPLVFRSDSAGKIKISNINIQYKVIDKTPPAIQEITISPNPAKVGDLLNISAKITDNVGVEAVEAVLGGETIPLVYNNVSGLYEGTIAAPSVGNYNLTITAKDKAELTVTEEIKIAVILTVAITSLNEGDIFAQAEEIVFSGVCSLAGVSMTWTSSIDGEIGTGSSFAKANLSPGTHTITFSAVDANGVNSTDSVNIIVVETGAELINVFSDESKVKTITFDSGGSRTEYLKIPAKAQVKIASLDLKGFAGMERRIAAGDSFDAVIWGNKIIYTSGRKGNDDIYMYDLDTDIETPICIAPRDQDYPAIYDNKIVWQDKRNTNGDIYMYDLSTGKETQITRDSASWYYNYEPDIYGDKIVYWGWEGQGNYTYLYDLSTGIETKISRDRTDGINPKVFGNKIVWQVFVNSNWDIYVYNLSTGIETPICIDLSYQSEPAIYGDKIVWEDKRNGNADIYMYDLSTGTETQITADPWYQGMPDIYGDKIVYEDWRTDNGAVYMYDLSTKEKTQISSPEAYSVYSPVIYEDKIVWSDCRSDDWTVYLYELSMAVTNPSLHVGDGEDIEWGYAGEFTGFARTPDFTVELNEYLSMHPAGENGYVLAPLVFYSETGGQIEISNVDIQYVISEDKTPPVIGEIAVEPGTVYPGDTLIVTAMVTDNVGIEKMEAEINGSMVLLGYNSETQLYAGNTSAPEVGQYIIKIRAVDTSGLVSSKQTTLTVSSVQPDLTLSPADISFVPAVLADGVSAQVKAVIRNKGNTAVDNFEVQFHVDGSLAESRMVEAGANAETLVKFDWIGEYGSHTLAVRIDPGNAIAESDETNNIVERTVFVLDTSVPVINNVTIPALIYEGDVVLIQAKVTDNVGVSSVKAEMNGSVVVFGYNSDSGWHEGQMTMPQEGDYVLKVTAVDINGLVSSRQGTIIVRSILPDLALDFTDISLAPQEITEGNVLTVNAIVHNNGKTKAEDFGVEFQTDGNCKTIRTLSVEGESNSMVQFSWNAVYGSHKITVKADFSGVIAEFDESNNESSKTVFVADVTPPPAPCPVVEPAGWTNQTVHNVSWEPVTDTNGIARYEYRIGYEDWTSVGIETGFVVSETEGVHTVYVRAVDNPENAGQEAEVGIYIDLSPPNTPVIKESHCGTKWRAHSSPYFSWIDPGDEGSGIISYKASIDNGLPVDLGNVLFYHPAWESGAHTFRIYAVDGLGQESGWSNEITVWIDLDPPPASSVSSLTHPDQNKWYAHNAPVFSWNIPQDLSGIEGFYYSLTRSPDSIPDIYSLWLRENSYSAYNLPDGVWYFHLIVQDKVGYLSAEAAHYQVKVDRTLPLAEAGPGQEVIEGAQVTFDGSGSSDNLSGIADYRWDFGDANAPDETGEGINPVHVYGDNGVYAVSLSVYDKAGNGPAVDTIVVTVSNVPPIVKAGSDLIVDENSSVLFKGFFTDPGRFDTHEAFWDFGDGAVPVEASIVKGDNPANEGIKVLGYHNYESPGVYTVTLTVKDDDGGEGKDSLHVVVQDALAPEAILMSPSPDSIGLCRIVNGMVTVTGIAHDAHSVDMGDEFSSPDNFGWYKLEYAPEKDTLGGWQVITDKVIVPVTEPVILADWDTTQLSPGYYTLKLTVSEVVKDDNTTKPNISETTVTVYIGEPEKLFDFGQDRLNKPAYMEVLQAPADNGQAVIYLPDGKQGVFEITLGAGEDIFLVTDTNNDVIAVYIGDSSRKKIEFWDEVFTADFAGKGKKVQSSENKPQGIAVELVKVEEEEGVYWANIYLVDGNNDRLLKITPDGAVEIGKNIGFNKPTGIGLDMEGRIYLTDTNNDRLVVLNSDGSLLKEIKAGFNKPAGIDVINLVDDEGNFVDVEIYVTDRNNDRVMKIDMDGRVMMAIGTLGNGPGQFNKPMGVYVNERGYIFVTDSNNDRIQKFDGYGRFMMQFGGFNKPVGIKLNSGSETGYVVDRNNDCISLFGLP